MKGEIPPCIPDNHPHRVTNTKRGIDKVISPEDGHIVAQNMYGKDKHTKKNYAPIWLYLQDERVEFKGVTDG